MSVAASQSAACKPPAAKGVLAHLRSRIEELHPAYFAMVMATGIVSIACYFASMKVPAYGLFWVDLTAYVLLWVCTAARLFWFPKRVIADLASHQRGPGFFTLVAATGVLGVQLVLLFGEVSVAVGLWWLALILWGVLTFTIFAVLSVKQDKPTLGEGINGGWLLAVVATQALVVLGCAAGPQNLAERDVSLFILASLWLCGGMLYIWMISLIFYRYMFFKFDPADLMPPYWINMGAVAISTLAGARLAAASAGSPLLEPLMPFIKGLSVMFWATATWWIPLLVVLGVWRHKLRGLRLVYDPLYWGLVFPMGMYSVCTVQLSAVLGAPFLLGLSQVFVVIALIAWLLTFFGLGARFLHFLLLARRSLAQLRGTARAQLKGENHECESDQGRRLAPAAGRVGSR